MRAELADLLIHASFFRWSAGKSCLLNLGAAFAAIVM
jgi:hypothetical protein